MRSTLEINKIYLTSFFTLYLQKYQDIELPNILKQNFTFLFEEDIWKIIFDSALSLIVVELRNTDTKKISVGIIDYKNPRLSMINGLNIEWWSSLSAMHNGNLIIQKYKSNKFPEPKGFQCYNIFKENLLIDENDSSFASFTENGIIATKTDFEKIVYEVFHFEEQGFTKKVLNEDLGSDTFPSRPINILFPLQYNAPTEHFNTVKTFIKRSTDKDAIVNIEYMETTSFVVVSYYIRGFERLDNYLLIANMQGKVLLDEKINPSSDGIGKDTFLIKENQLIFIKNKKEIQSYAL